MRKGFVEPVVLPQPRFRDGLGIRYVRTDGTDDPVEVLRPLWDVGKMQNAIRQRVGRLATFRQARFVPVRTAEVPRDDPSTIEVVSDFVSGHRLSQYLEASKAEALAIQTSTAIHILRELLGALALLHESRGLNHGAVGPERILITPKGRAVVADYVLGPAIERLEFSRSRLWREFRIPLPAGKGPAKLDDLADVMQVGATALALLAGRPLELDEYPNGLDALVAAVAQARGSEGRTAVPAALVGWVKRALQKDPSAGFANVREARLALETVLSKQNAATGGAAALKSMAESFGRYAAALEAEAAAAAAEEARQAALAAQAATAAEALRTTAADADGHAAAPAVESVPAFTLPSGSPAGLLAGALEDGAPATVPAAVAYSDPPVGWRVPQPAPVEDTLPTSPLLQFADAAGPTAIGEFDEEVLDLGSLASSDEADSVAADAVMAVEPVAVPVELDRAQPPVAATPEGLAGAIVDSRELEAAGVTAESVEPRPAGVESAPASLALAETEAVAAAPKVAPLEESIRAAAAVEAALAALAALEAPAPSARPDALPEWRLLADPLGAIAPTIDVEEPTESLEELVAEFAARKAIEGPPAVAAGMPVPELDQPSMQEELSAIVAQPPVAMAEAPSPDEGLSVAMAEAPSPDEGLSVAMAGPPAALMEAPAEYPVPGADQPAEDEAPAAAAFSVLDEIVGLQEAQASAQAAVESAAAPPAPDPDIAAWSFVEELLHHDARFPARQYPEDASTGPVADEPPPRPPAIEAEPAEVPADVPDAMEPAALVEETAAAEAPEADQPVPALPADWFIEVGARPSDQTPVFVREREPEESPYVPAAQLEEPPPRAAAAPDAGPSLPPVALHAELPEADEDSSGQVFPRVAPSIRRVRAEARRRRLARIRSSVGGSVRALLDACVSGVAAVAGGTVHVFSSAGRGTAALGRATLSVVVVSGAAVSRGVGATIRAAATGTAAVANGAARAGIKAAGVTGAAVGSALAGTGRGLLAVAGALAAAAGAASRAGVAIARAGGRGLLAAAGAASRAGVAIVRAGGRGLLAAAGAAFRVGVVIARAGGRGSLAAVRTASRAGVVIARAGAGALAATARALAVGLGVLGRAGRSGTVAGLRGMGRAAGAAASWAAAGARGVSASTAVGGRAAGRAAAKAGSVAAAAAGLAGRGAALTGKGLGRAAVTVPRQVYFVASDIADHLPRPVFRLWHLAAALVVIVAVAGVPYARARFFTAKPAVGQIRVESARPGAMVTIDGVAQGRAPLTATVPAGRHRIEVTIAGRTRAHDVEVGTGRETLVQAAGADLKGMGSIRVTSDPAGAEVLVDGVFHGTAPVTIENVAEGTHTILVRDGSGSVQQTVRVRAEQAVIATLQIRPGWLAVFAPVRLDILENGRPIGSTEGGRVRSSPGPHTIEVVSQAMGFRETRQVDIKPGEVTAVTIAMPPVAIEVVAPAEAEILVDGQPVGTAPVGRIQVAVGTREILMRHPTLGERRQVVSVTYNAPLRVVFE